MTQDQEKLANDIFNSIQVIMTEDVKKTHHLDTLDKQIEYTRQEKLKQTKEKLEKKGILL